MAWLHEAPVRSMLAIMAVVAVMTAVTTMTVVQMMAASRDEQSRRRQNHQTK